MNLRSIVLGAATSWYSRWKSIGGPRGIDHIGITVPNMDVATRFLQEAFDAKIVYSLTPKGAAPRQGKHMEKTLALPVNSKIVRQTLMRLGTGPSLELFQISGTSQQPAHMLQDFGLQHFTVYVDDVEKSYRACLKAGATAYSPPHRPHGIEGAPKSVGVYIRPPWGGIVELFHYDSIRYPNPKITRWTPPEPTAGEE